MQFRRPMRAVVGIFASVMFALPVLAGKAAATTDDSAAIPAPLALSIPQTPASTPVSIGGFRSAQFDMNEHAVRKAIKKDFGFGDSAIQSSGNPLQQTMQLSITVPSLIPGSGKAQISYVFGYKSKGLVEVNILWKSAADSANSQDALVHAGAILQNYFETEPFPANQSLANAVLADGSVVLFRGVDGGGHVAVLVLAGSLSNVKNHHAAMVPNTLSLVYASNPDHPDIFQLAAGSF